MPTDYGVPEAATGMVPWSKTRGVLERAQSHWLVTIDADGKPHLVGQWGAWIDDRWYFEGGADTNWHGTSHASRASRWAWSATRSP